MSDTQRSADQPEARPASIEQLAAALVRHGLTTPARMTLDALEPIDFVASQIALFFRPLTPIPRWRAYLSLLSDEAAWRELRALVNR
jgi:hypothetical protein